MALVADEGDPLPTIGNVDGLNAHHLCAVRAIQ
jgi:hypothetical protein